MPTSAWRARMRRAAAGSALVSGLAVGGVMTAQSASAAEPAPSTPTSSAASVSAAPATTTASTASTGAATPTASPSATPAASSKPGASSKPASTASTKTTPAPAKGAPSKAHDADHHVVLGVTPPRNPDAATTDAEGLAWALAHTSSDAERRDMADVLEARYPTDIEILGARCASGKPGVEVWVINFQTRAVDWDVTVDGAAYASATVKPLSHDYGVLTVPSGTHTVAFVNPSTGAVAASRTVSLACGPTKPSNAGVPAHSTRPAHHRGSTTHTGDAAKLPTGSGATAPVGRPAVRHGMPHATHAPAVVAPQGAQQGPKVQTDLATRTGQTPGALAVVAMFAAVAGAGAFARRVMRA